MTANDERVREVDPRVSRPGGVSYLQIPADDVAAAARFYESVFGWTASGDDTERRSFEDGSGHVAGAWMRSLAVSREPGLLPYIYVDDVDEIAERIVTEGGQIVKMPYAQGNLRVGTFRDPAGNVMGFWTEPTI